MINSEDVDDNESVKWCLVGYLKSADHHPARLAKADKSFAKRLDFKVI